MPVTTTIGLPSLSRGADMVPSSMLRRIKAPARQISNSACALHFQARLRAGFM
jgi:hypothetical protein